MVLEREKTRDCARIIGSPCIDAATIRVKLVASADNGGPRLVIPNRSSFTFEASNRCHTLLSKVALKPMRIMEGDGVLRQVNEIVYLACAFSRDDRFTADIPRNKSECRK